MSVFKYTYKLCQSDTGQTMGNTIDEIVLAYNLPDFNKNKQSPTMQLCNENVFARVNVLAFPAAANMLQSCTCQCVAKPF